MVAGSVTVGVSVIISSGRKFSQRVRLIFGYSIVGSGSYPIVV